MSVEIAPPALQLFLCSTSFPALLPQNKPSAMLPPILIQIRFFLLIASLHPHNQALLSLPPFLFCSPSLSLWWQIRLMCYACACVLGADTHARAHLCSAAVEASCDPATQSKTRLLNRPNICLGCLSQSPWLLKLAPLSACCWFVCFLVRLCERKCGFPVRAGSWIKSAQTQRLADNCC